MTQCSNHCSEASGTAEGLVGVTGRSDNCALEALSVVLEPARGAFRGLEVTACLGESHLTKHRYI